MKKFLITGGAGFIGSHMCLTLLEKTQISGELIPFHLTAIPNPLRKGFENMRIEWIRMLKII